MPWIDAQPELERPPEYTSWSEPLQEMLAGCIVEYPSRFIGRGLLRYAPDKRALAERLQGVPGVTFIPQDKPPAEAEIYIPHNLFVMGTRPSTLAELKPDPQETTPSRLRLKEYQRRSVTFLRAVSTQAGGAILGAAAGLGKSITVLQALWLDGYLQRGGLIVGPLGAQEVWCGERSDAAQHFGLQVIPLEGLNPHNTALAPNQWYFIHYDVIQQWASMLFSQLRPLAVVFDEVHLCMNSTGKRWRAAMALSGWVGTERRYGLTGTPIPKTRLDLYGQLAVVQPGQWGSTRFAYGMRYCGGKRLSHTEGQGHWVFEDQTNSDELRARLAGVYLRFGKEEVASDLPKLTRVRLDVELPPEVLKEYRQARSSVKEWLESQGKREAPKTIKLGSVEVKLDEQALQAPQLVTTSVLRSILDRGKLPQARQVIGELAMRHKHIVVFTWKRASAKQLYNELLAVQWHFTIFGPIDGTDPWPKRRKIAAEFAASPAGILVATRGSVGIAINDLSAAEACLQITPDWNPDGNLQAESRLHREGARAPEIFSYYMLARGTLDDRVLQLLDEKGQEAYNLASQDNAAMHLVAALDPTVAGGDWSREELFAMLDGVEDLG